MLEPSIGNRDHRPDDNLQPCEDGLIKDAEELISLGNQLITEGKTEEGKQKIKDGNKILKRCRLM
jgi:hypothetical protein